MRALIDEAARLTGKTRTGFVLDAARHAAEDALQEQTVFRFGAKAFAQFQRLLDAPPKPNERLRKTMRTPAPWD